MFTFFIYVYIFFFGIVDYSCGRIDESNHRLYNRLILTLINIYTPISRKHEACSKPVEISN